MNKPSSSMKESHSEKRESWLGNNWLITVIGGVIATVLGTYIYNAYFSSNSPASSAAASQSTSGSAILIQVDPDQISSRNGPATINAYVSGLTPDGAVEGDVFDPSGSTYYVESTSADPEGDWTFAPRWSPTYPHGGETPIGNYRITIVDKTTGATATAILHVIQ
jgi:hypothetical protein